MIRLVAVLAGLLAMALAAGAAAAPKVTDDTGRVVELRTPARRIVSLSPHTTELLFAAGAGDRVVGVVDYSDFPEAARRITNVGSSRSLDLERILTLRPDLLVAWRSGNGERQVDALRGLGIPMFESEPATLADVATGVERLGELAGTGAVAQAEAQRFRAALEAVREQYAKRAPVTVFHQIWDSPLMTVNGRHLISDVLALCGGRNVFAGLPALTPAVSTEAVLEADPEVISTASVLGAEAKSLDPWKRWSRLTAVARGNLVIVHPDVISRHSPRIVEGARALCAALETARSRRVR